MAIARTRAGRARAAIAPFLCLALLSAACSSNAMRPEAEPPAPVPVREAPAIDPRALDAQLQQAAAEALGDREGAILVIDPRMGRLRAAVNPRIAFEQAWPPGSAIKPFTSLAALRGGLVDRQTSRLCETRYAREGFEIVCSHPRSKTPFNLSQALAWSCNDYFAHLAERLSEGSFNAALSGFGFGARTGVSAAESPGALARGEWRVETALGESPRLLVTPVQLIAAYAALVNGGRLHRPQLTSDPTILPQEVARLTIAPAHREALIEGMRGAVKYGTAARARLGELPGYLFGKTGTSTASNGFRTQGWFVGFTADRPATGTPRPEQVGLGVLVFLKRAHGAECAELARPLFALALGVSREARETRTTPDAPAPGGETVRVRSISEKATRELGIEAYLQGVLAAEASIESELEALKAQAVISRSFAQRNRNRHAGEGYDFCSTTHCQRFAAPSGNVRESVRRAVAETTGEIVGDGSRQVIDAYFHAACGGVTANIETLWGAPAPSYLRGVRDDFCASMPHHRWVQSIPVRRLAEALRGDERTDPGPRLDAILVTKRDATGRAETLTLEGARRRTVRGWDFKIVVGRALGWQMVKSSRFEVARAGDAFVFRGGGFGHGLGLCQEGAHVMARRGMNYRQILGHYFPGTVVTGVEGRGSAIRPAAFTQISFGVPPFGGPPSGGLALANGPQRTVSTEKFRVRYPETLDPGSLQTCLGILKDTHAEYVRRLAEAALRIPETPPFEIVIHANTAEFIAATGQSGWAAGVTKGRRIEIQPPALLRRRGELANTLRHELAHAFIESLSESRAPRWLAEGLAIHAAGEGPRMAARGLQLRLSTEELERRLSAPSRAAEARELYGAAYREVRKLLDAEKEAGVWKRVAEYRSKAKSRR
ncbi:MAG: SpoIID/LytB domain-containing protein [Blastocatellia bacterium]|nr:SpoIID/LytB domain-containing protein [Blastocatellia bacterium]